MADGLTFLAADANLVHRALCPATIFITAAGAWKLGGLGLSIPAHLTAGHGAATAFDFMHSGALRVRQAVSLRSFGH